MSNAPGEPVSFSRPKVGYFSNRPRILILYDTTEGTGAVGRIECHNAHTFFPDSIRHL